MRDYAKGPVKGREGATRDRLWHDRFGYVHLQGDNFYRCLFDGTDPKYGKSVARDLRTIINEACRQAIADTRKAERMRAAELVAAIGCACPEGRNTSCCVTTVLINKILGAKPRKGKV